MDIIRWVWVVMALFFGVAEIFTAGFVLICFGIGAAAAAILAFVGLGLVWQLGAFIVVSAVSVVLSRRFAERVSGPQMQGVGIDRVLGKEAVVIEAIDPLSAHGRVRIDREEWRADSADGAPIAQDMQVEVLRVEGTRVIVRPQAVDEP